MMLKAEKELLKKVKSLQQKKFRGQFSQFTIEGPKLINEFISVDAPIVQILGTKTFFENNNLSSYHCLEISDKDLSRISSLKNPNKALAIVSNFKTKKTDYSKGLHLVLDNIKDPGNLGTIIRIADWFNFDSVLLSPETVDEYNPKVIQSSMGSLAKVKINRGNIITALKDINTPIYATSLNGKDIYKNELNKKDAIIVIGSESHGISEETEQLASQLIKIPLFGSAESLNAAVATGIVCAEFKR